MKQWCTRIFALLFVFSLVATPQMAVLATEDLPGADPAIEGTASGTPDGFVEDTESGADVGTESDSTDESAGSDAGTPEEGIAEPDADTPGEGPVDADAGTPETGTDATDAPNTEADPGQGEKAGDGSGDLLVKPLSLVDGFYSVPLPSFDTATGQFEISMTFINGFTVAVDGRTESFVVTYDPGALTLDPLAAPLSLAGVPGAQVTLDPVAGIVTITFTEYFEVIGDTVDTSVSLNGSVDFEACQPTFEAYAPYVNIWVSTPTNGSTGLSVYGSECPASADPLIEIVSYDDSAGKLITLMIMPQQPVAGQSTTLTYQTDKILMETGPVDIVGFSSDGAREYVIGTATAADGLITYTFFDPPVDEVFDPVAIVEMTGWLTNANCDEVTGTEYVEVGDLQFVSHEGLEFDQFIPGMLCNAAPATKIGEWSTDSEGNPIIIWTIDTGDVMANTWISDYGHGGGFSFNCSVESFTFSVISGEADFTIANCGDSYFDASFSTESDEPFRAVLTVVSYPNVELPPTSYINCASIDSLNLDLNGSRATAQGSNGLGGNPCYELFPLADGSGDMITTTVDKPEAKPGDVLTYTIEVSTSADMWASITLTNPLPAGVVPIPESITCSVEPAVFMADPCFTFVDGVITVTAWPVPMEQEGDFNNYRGGPATITVTIQGTVSAEPGTVITNNACSQRRPWFQLSLNSVGVGDPTIIGGGVICASADTLVIPLIDPATPDPEVPVDPATPDPATPTPTEPATPAPTEPATPGATPTAPVTPDPTATATSAVTGLPETGTGNSSGLTMLLGALAASVLVAGAIGLRTRALRG